MERRHLVVFLAIALFQALLGVSSQWPASITPDAAMHAEIVELVRAQGYPTSWEPYASTPFTYPPLFHWLAAMLPLAAIDAVRALGLVVWLLVPLAMYFLAGTFEKRAGMIAALLIAVVPSFSLIFLYGEFPELLGMLLLVWQWYFLRKKRFAWAGVFAGLVALSHPFLALVAVVVQLGHLPGGVRQRIAALALPVAAASPWIPAYVQIAGNALAGVWENVAYNTAQPVFGFWGVEQLYAFLLGPTGVTVLLLSFAAVGFFAVRERFLQGFFLLCLAFAVFHLPLTQLKFLDVLALPAVVLASLGLVSVGKKRGMAAFAAGVVVVVLAAMTVQEFQRAPLDWFNPEIAPGAELADAAQWLGRSDAARVRIYAHGASAWAGVLANKLPLDPSVSFIEAFSDDYRKQLAAQREIHERLENGEDARELAERYGVKYLLVPRGIAPEGTEALYENEGWGVRGVSG